MDDGTGLKLAKGRRAKRARIKRGMRGSGKRAERHRLRIFNLTKKKMCNDDQNMTAEEVKDCLGQQKSKNDEISPKEEEELLDKCAKDVEQQIAIDKEKAAVKERRSVMSTKVPTYGDWTPEVKGDKELTFFRANINSLAYWSRYSNKADRLRYIFDKYGIDLAGLQEVCVNWAQLP